MSFNRVQVIFNEFRGFSIKQLFVLVQVELIKLLRNGIIQAGYIAMVGIALLGSYLVYHAEQAVKITSGSGYAFAIGLILRCADFGAPILFLMMCVVFSMEMAYSTIKNMITRPITRIELMVGKYLTALILILIAILIWTSIGLSAGAFYYGLGDLTEDGYVLFKQGTMYKELAIALVLELIPFMAIAGLGLMVSSFSSTMGGALLVGIIGYIFFELVGIIPVNLGFRIGEHFFPYSTFGFTTLRFIPLYIIDDLPAGLPIESWWVWDVKKMIYTCGGYFLIFFLISLWSIERRDFTV